MLGRGAFQDVDLSAVFRDVAASTVTVHAGSDHGELAATAVKHAIDGRGVAHLVLPDEVQDVPSDAPAGRADADGAPTRPSPRTATSLDAALDRLRAATPAGVHRRRGARGAAPSCARWPSGSARRCSPRSGPRASCRTPIRSAPACSAGPERRSRRG